MAKYAKYGIWRAYLGTTTRTTRNYQIAHSRSDPQWGSDSNEQWLLGTLAWEEGAQGGGTGEKVISSRCRRWTRSLELVLGRDASNYMISTNMVSVIGHQ